MSERIPQFDERTLHENMHGIWSSGSNGIAQGLSLDGSSLIQVVWWRLHSLDMRDKRLIIANDNIGPTMRTVATEYDGTTNTFDTMLTGNVRGTLVQGRRHIVTSSDTTTKVARLMCDPRTPHPMDKVGEYNQPEGATEKFRRIIASVNIANHSRPSGTGPETARLQFLAHRGGPSKDPQHRKPLSEVTYDANYKNIVIPGVAVAVYGSLVNDDTIFETQPTPISLGPSSSVEGIAEYIMDRLMPMAAGVRRIPLGQSIDFRNPESIQHPELCVIHKQ